MNWTVNVWDLILIGIGGVILYARLVAAETKLDPLWKWWNDHAAESIKRTLGREKA